MGEEMMGVYRIINTQNKKVYIGGTNNIKSRWLEHKKHLRNGAHVNVELQSDWNEYGEATFAFEVLEFVENRSSIVVIEQRWIDKQSAVKCYNSFPAHLDTEKRKPADGHVGMVSANWIRGYLSDIGINVNTGTLYKMTIPQIANRYHVDLAAVIAAAKGEKR